MTLEGSVRGTISNLTFSARVNSEPCTDGINEGRVRCLMLRDESAIIAMYDQREWLRPVPMEYIAIYKRVLHALEELPALVS